MRSRFITGTILAAFTLTSLTGIAAAAAQPLATDTRSIPAAPTLEKPVVDETRTLTVAQIAEISAIINEGRALSGQETAVLAIDSLDGQAIEEFSLNVARDWGVGDEQADNGVLIVVAVDDRKLRIEVGRGLEGDLPDAIANRIGDDIMVPYMKEDDLYGALIAGAQAVQVGGDRTATSPNGLNSSVSFDPFGLVIGGLLLAGFGALWTHVGRLEKKRKAAWLAEHGNLDGYVPAVTTTRTGDRDRGRSHRNNGGSSRSLGGGGFSGGGSSSRW